MPGQLVSIQIPGDITMINKVLVFVSLASLSLVQCGRQEKNKKNARSENETSSETKPNRLVVLGDSITVGVLANTNLGDGDAITALLEKNVKNIAAALTKDVAISQEELDEIGNEKNAHPELTALQGSEEWALPAQLGIEKKDVIAFAKNGSKLSQIADLHLPKINEALKASNNKNPVTHVAMMLGANDFCSGISAEEFRKNASKSLNTLVGEFPDSKILVAFLPPFDKLSTFKYEYIAKPKVSCEVFQNHYCARMKKGDPEEFKSFNKVLKEEVAKISATTKANIVTVDATESLAVTSEKMAVDCFHPNVEGQKLIADAFKAVLAK